MCAALFYELASLAIYKEKGQLNTKSFSFMMWIQCDQLLQAPTVMMGAS